MATAVAADTFAETAAQTKRENNDEKSIPEEVETVLDKLLATEENKKVEIINNPHEEAEEPLKVLDKDDDGGILKGESEGKTSSHSEDINDETTLQDKKRDTNEKTLSEEVERGLDKLLATEENNPQEVCDGGTAEGEKMTELSYAHKAIAEENYSSAEYIGKPCSKTENEIQENLFSEAEDGEGKDFGIILNNKGIPPYVSQGESEEKTSHSEDTIEGTTLKERHLHEEMGNLTDIVGGISENKRENDEMQPVEPEVVLDKQAQEGTNIVEIDNPCESLKNNEDDNDGTAEVEKAVELHSVAKAIEEPNSSPEPIENPINTEDEMLPIEPEVVLEKQAPEETSTVEIDNPHESLKTNEDGNDGAAEVEMAVELHSVTKAIEEPNSSPEPIENPINAEDETLPIEPEVVLEKQAPEETNTVEIDNPHESSKNNEDCNDRTVEVEKAVELPSVAKAIEEPKCPAEPIEKPINTEDVQGVNYLLASQSVASEIKETNLDEAVPVIPKPLAYSAQVSETVLQVDINTNDTDDNQSKILEKDMVDGSLPQENHKEKLSDMITEHEKPASMEAPRGLHTDDNVTVTVCEGISEVKQQCIAEMSKDDADSKNSTSENNAEISLYDVHEEIERSGFQQNTELTFRKELILDKIDDVILKGESEDEFSHSENINDGIALHEKLHEEMAVIADIEEGTSETQLHEEIRTLTDIVGGISENQRENDEMQPVEPQVVLDKQAPEETNTVGIDNPCESLKNNEDGDDGTVEVEKAVELSSVAKAIEEPNSSPEPIENPINTEDQMLPIEPEVVLDKQAPEETNTIEIDNPCESLKNNEDGNDGTVEVEKAVELPSVAKAIEEPNSSIEPIEKAINTEDEMLPVEPEVVLDKQAPEETNMVEIDNPCESLKNNEDGNKGTVEVEKVVELPSVAKAIEEPYSSLEPIENPINTEDEILPIQPEVVLDKQALEETNMPEIDNPFESLKNNEDGNGGVVDVEKVVDSVSKAIEEPNSSVEPIEKPINTEDEMLPVEPEVVLDKQAPEETNTVEIDIPSEFLKNNEDGNDGTVEVEEAVELPSAAKAIEEPKSSPEPIENPINTEDEMLPVEPEVVLHKQAPEETNTVEIDNPCESLKNNEDGNDGTVEVEKAVELSSAAKAIEELNSSAGPIENPINTDDEILPVQPEVVLDKQAPEETNMVEIDNPCESLENNEDANDGTVEVEKAIEEPNSSVEPIEKPINTDDEMLPSEPEVVLDKQALEESNTVEIGNPHEFLKKNEDGNDGTVMVEKAVDLSSAAKAIEEPNSSPGESEDKFSHSENINDGIALHEKQLHEEMATIADIAEGTSETLHGKMGTLSAIVGGISENKRKNDEMQPVEPEVVLDKQAPEEANIVEIDNRCESLKNNEDGNDGAAEVELAVELPSVAKAIEEPNSSVEPIEKAINTEDEMQQVETEVVLDKQALEETNTIEIDNPCESLKNNEDGNDGTVEVVEAVELPSAAKGIEEPKSSPEPIENPIDTEDEMLPVEPEAVLHKQAPEETNTVEIDNPCEYLKNNEDGNDGTVEVVEAVELPSAAKAIEEPKSSPEPIENPINTEDEMLPVEPEVVLHKQAPEETNTVGIDNPCESLKNNEDGNDGTVEVEKAVELPSAAKAIEELNSSAEPIENPINTDDEILPVQPEVVLDKQAPEETNMVEIDNPCESLENNEDANDGTVEVEKAIEEPNSSVEPIEKTINTEDEMLPSEPEVVLDKQALEESNTVEIGNPHEFLKKNEDGNDGTVKVEKAVDLPSAAKAIEEPNSSSGESEDKFSHSENINDGIALHEKQLHEEMATIANVLDKDDDKGKTPEEISVQADLTETLKDSEESGETCKEQGKPFIPAPPSEVFTADLQGKINTSDNDYSNQSKILEQDTIVDGNLSTACKAQENPEEKLSDLITEHEGNLPKESEGPVSTEASRGLHTDENETTAVCEVTSQMKQHGIAETVKDYADSKNSICQSGAEKNLNAAEEEFEGSCLQQNIEPTTFSKELISEQSNEGILEGEGEDKASHSQITYEGITLQEKQLHEEVATVADIAEGTSETKRENDEKTLPGEHEIMLDKLAPVESKKVEIGNPHEISKSSEEGSDGTVECEKMIELPSVAKDTIEENNRSTEPTENPSNTEDELPGELFSEGENREGRDTGTILNREIPPNESQPEAEEPSKALETDDEGMTPEKTDEGMTPEKTFVQADAVINCPADFTENLKEDREKSGEVCNENESTQCILATKTSFPNDDSNETNVQGIADKEQDKDFIPEGENMDSLVVESHDDKEDGKVKKEESLAETCKIPLMEIQSQSSDSQDAHNVIGSPLSTSPTEETSSEKVGSSEVEPESTKASSDTMEDEFAKQEILSYGSSSCQISSEMEHNIEHDEVETETIQGVNDFLGSQLVSPEIKETGSGEGTSASETTADPAPLIEVNGTVLEDGVHMNENKEDHQCKIIEKDNIVDDSVTVQEENITRAGEEQASEELLRGLHRDENETVAVHDVISEVEQQDTVELSKDDVDSKDSLFKYESEKENLHAPCEETEKEALPQNADQTAFNEELISVKDDDVLRGESEDKAAHSDNNGETNPQETNMLPIDLDEAKSIQRNENSEWSNYSTVDEKPEQQIYTPTDMPTEELKYAYETNKIPEIEVLGDTSVQGQSDLDLISACPDDIHVAEDIGENSNEMCLEEVADMENQEDQIKQDGSQRATSEVRGNLSKGIENEISKDSVCSNTIIDKEESLNSRIPRGNEEEAKESKEEIKEPIKEANYHNFQTTHADTEEQVICVLTNAQNTMQSEEKMLPKEKECHVQNFSLLKTPEENEEQILETAEPLMAATGEMETELVEVQGKIAPVSSGLASEKDVVTGNEMEVDADETDTVPNQENDSSLNRKVNVETVAAGEDTDTREMSLHEEQIEACLSITDDKVASSLEEENPITKIVNETTIAETSSPLETREGMVTKENLLEEEHHSVINSEGRSLNDLEEEKLELNEKSLEHRTEDFMINSSDSTTKVHPKSVQPDEELIPSSQSVAEEGDESITSDGALTSSAEEACPQKSIEVGTTETSKDEGSEMFQDKLVPENTNVEPKNLDASYSTDKEIQGAGMEETCIETSELDSEKSDHIIESASEVHKLEMPLEAEKVGFVEENPAETETEEIVIKETNEENDIIKEDISSEQTQIADQSVIVKSSLDYPEEVLSLDAYQEVELKPEENEFERLGENESIKEEASSGDKAGAESSVAQDSEALHAIETAVAEESHDGNGKEISEMSMLHEQVKHSIALEKQNEELQSIVDGADTEKTLEDEKLDSCTEVQEGITGEADGSKKTESSTPNASECVQLMQQEPVLTAVKPEIQELEAEKVSGAPSETEMNQPKTNEMSTNTSEETSHEHGHDEIQSDGITNSQGPGETTMEMAKDGETEVQQKNLDFSFNIKDSAMENSSTETEPKDVQDNIDIIESAQEHVPAKIQNDNSTDSEEKGSKNEATEAASNEAAGLECGEDAKTEVEVNKVTDRSQTMESSTLSDSNLVLGSIEESSQVTEREDTKSQTEKLCDFTHKDSEMTQPREFPSDFTEIKNYIDDKLAQHESKVAVLDTEFPAEADPHENTEVRTSNEDNDSQEMQQNSVNDLEEMKPENAGETKNMETTDPKDIVQSMQEKDTVVSTCENISSNNINASKEETKERRTLTEARDEASMAGLPRACLNEREVIFHKEEDEASKVETEQHEEARSDQEEEEGGEHKGEDSGPEAPVMVENAGAGDADVKASKKKHHNILSGVGSKVKHSIAKVKKVITGKSSPTKQQSPK
ncbi:uncharacterized protein LOC115999938 isoform X3 [Ipomoea triloba]|uniref:uncharacterized protein LOC115999938 isoform X3 n=1 Tax=Ipomoea triloba TaxID=35885 RepID=UPI00125D6574|nr:uncharacterized protein LOC115999938 isoform X3 [Ipomoea triloba]